MRLLQKLVFLQDVQVTLQTREFPDLANKMGTMGAYEYFTQQHKQADDREAIKRRNAEMWEAMQSMK